MTQDAQASGSGLSQRGRTWLIIGILIALVGIGISLYSTLHHLEVKATGQTDAACNINATFNCDEVALSRYSEVFGLPLGVLGLGYFAANVVLLGLGLAGGKTSREHTHAYVAMVGIGLLVSIVMGSISWFSLGALCLACMGIYLLTLIQAGLLWSFRREIPPGFELKSTFSGGSTAAIAVAVVIAAFSWLRPQTATSSASDPATKPRDPDAPTLTQQAVEIPVTRSAYAGLGEDYRKGPDNAPVVIVEFADFQCPACQRVSGTLEALQREYADKVQLVFRNYPLDSSCNGSIQGKMHEFACKAAVMSRCAGQYGKFWQYYDLVFANQKDLSDAKLREWSKQIGLTDEQVDVCWSSADHLSKVKDDIDLGNKLGVDSTPTIYINGRKVVGGKSLQDLRADIDQILAQ